MRAMEFPAEVRERAVRCWSTHVRLDLVGFAFTASVIDVFSRFIAGWRGVETRSLQACRSTRSRYPDRFIEAGIDPSVGSVGDSYDNALAETIIGLYKAEVIHRRRTWKGVEDVEFATLNGSTGSTIDDCSSPLGTSRLRSSRATTTNNNELLPLW